jgi:hypothetical protein
MHTKTFPKTLLVISILLWAAGSINAQTMTPQSVSAETALKVAQTHISSMKDYWGTIPGLERKKIEVDTISELLNPADGFVLGYVVRLKPKGFVVISSSTGIHPVIAFSFRGNLPWKDHPDNILLHMLRNDLALRHEALVFMEPEQIESQISLWEDYVAGKLTKKKTHTYPDDSLHSPTGGWVQTTWSQGYPYYAYCPKDPRSGDTCVTGCVATAMAQVVNYWAGNYPPYYNMIGGINFTPFDTSAGSSDRYISRRTTPVIHIDQDSTKCDFFSFNILNAMAVDLDRYYRDLYPDDTILDDVKAWVSCLCGFTLMMQYSPTGSSSTTSYIADQLANRFNYKNAEWMPPSDELFVEIKKGAVNGFPCVLAITRCEDYKKTGHSIVCDGVMTYDRDNLTKDDKYHLNFGWGSGNPDEITHCWYHLLPLELPKDYTTLNGGVVDIEPPN